MEHKPRHVGVPVFMAGQEYIVPSLRTDQFRECYALLAAPIAEDQTIADFIDERVPIVKMALRRNYPALSDEELADMIDIGNFNELLRAVQGASGMKAVRPGESQPVAAK